MNASKLTALGMAVAACTIAASGPAMAQTSVHEPSAIAPNYGSGVSAGALSDQNFNTPESDGRPGAKFFAYAVGAYRRHDLGHAVDMYKLAAYWAYAPAAYNLGVMYFKGEGVPVNRPLGAAWMVIAAQQGDPQYALVRDQMVTLLSHAEFAETDRIFGQLQPKYGEQVAMRRAKAQWAFARSQKTGSRVGGDAGELWVGVLDTGNSPPARSGTKTITLTATAFGLMRGGSTPGALAYRQFQESSNPYSVKFLQHRKGSATVGPLQPIDQSDSAAGKTTKASMPAAASSSGHDPA